MLFKSIKTTPFKVQNLNRNDNGFLKCSFYLHHIFWSVLVWVVDKVWVVEKNVNVGGGWCQPDVENLQTQ